MAYEYVNLSSSEIEYGQRNLLNSELEILETIKLSTSYHHLRKQEINLKIEFKKKLSELKQAVAEFEKLLPDMKEEKPLEKKNPAFIQSKKVIPQEEPIVPIQKNIHVKEVEESSAEKEAKRSLEREIEEIHKKLRAMH